MVPSRRLLFVVLIYVSLDLSLPSMPGAFVFDPGDSVESVHAGRGRLPISAITELPDTHGHGVTAMPDLGMRRDVLPKGDVLCGRSLPRVAPRGDRPRTIAGLTSGSEDPH